MDIPRSFYNWREEERSAFLTEGSRWVYCRDIFHKRITPTTIFFKTSMGNKKFLANVKLLLSELQERLELQDSEKIVIKDTNNPCAVELTLSKWWQSTLRYHFLTAFLRCSQSKADWKSVKAMIDYTNSYYFRGSGTRYAAQRFITRYTKIDSGWNNGWVRTFSRKTNDQIDKMLTK